MTVIEMSEDLKKILEKPNKLEKELKEVKGKVEKIKKYDSENDIEGVLGEVQKYIGYSGQLVYTHFTESDPPRCILITLGTGEGVITDVRPPLGSEKFEVSHVEEGIVGARFNYQNYDFLIKPIGKTKSERRD